MIWLILTRYIEGEKTSNKEKQTQSAIMERSVIQDSKDLIRLIKRL